MLSTNCFVCNFFVPSACLCDLEQKKASSTCLEQPGRFPSVVVFAAPFLNIAWEIEVQEIAIYIFLTNPIFIGGARRALDEHDKQPHQFGLQKIENI